MNLRTRIAAGATALALVSILGSATPASAAAPAVAPGLVAAQQAVDLPVTGTLPDGTIFTGQLSNLTASMVNGVPMLSGMIAGTGLPAAGTTFNTAISSAQAVCPVLDLNLQPLNLDLLGLVVNLDAVHLNIDAVTGPGKLLGNLVCQLAGALDANGLLQQIVPILNALLPNLGLAPVTPPALPITPPVVG